jgi:hypothetical protein
MRRDIWPPLANEPGPLVYRDTLVVFSEIIAACEATLFTAHVDPEGLEEARAELHRAYLARQSMLEAMQTYERLLVQVRHDHWQQMGGSWLTIQPCYLPPRRAVAVRLDVPYPLSLGRRPDRRRGCRAQRSWHLVRPVRLVWRWWRHC